MAVKKSVGKILKLLGDFPEITRESLAAEVGLSVRGVEKNLAQLSLLARSAESAAARAAAGRLWKAKGSSDG
jgi:hypothetical protein